MSSILKVDEIQDTLGNNIINENANTVTIGKSGDTVNVIGTLQNGGTNFAQGITESDQWRLTADFSTVGNNDITSNLERVDNTGFGYIGTGMSVSSGIWTFPSTGIYKVEAIAACALVIQDTMGVSIHFTTNNSTYTHVANSYYGGAAAGGELGMGYGSIMLDITDTANCKVKFRGQSIGSSNVLAGNTSQTLTHFNFIRLGDT
jgi:hypothetical protein